jgi:DNA-directed RNA polymerase specialized sigma24 family protein
MNAPNSQEHLSQIITMWTLVRQAHATGDDASSQIASAQTALMNRYHGAVYRYLLGALKDKDAADELFQEFALRFLRGDYRNVNPERGRFRQFLKTCLYHLIVDHQTRKSKQPLHLESHAEPAVHTTSIKEHEQSFVQSCRDDLLDYAWRALEDYQKTSNQPYYDVLRMRAENSDLRSQDLGVKLGEKWGKAFAAAATRQLLHRAREKFAEYLCEQVYMQIEHPTPEELVQELIDLGLWSYCKAVLPHLEQAAKP